MGEVATSTGALVTGGVGALLMATFYVALKIFTMADRKDEVSYDRLLELHEASERRHREERDADRRRHAEAMSALADRHAAELAEERAQSAQWRDRYIAEIGDST